LILPDGSLDVRMSQLGEVHPPGDAELQTTGLISGEASKAGPYHFTVQVVDTKTKAKPLVQHTATATLSIAIG